MKNKTWNKPFFAFNPLWDFDHNSTRFTWNKHVELCGIMWNKMWNKPTFNPLRDFDRNSTSFRMIPLAVPRLISRKNVEFHPLCKGWNYAVLCGIMWNKRNIPCVWRGCAAAPAPPTMLSLRPMTTDNSNGCASLHALLLCIWPMQLLYILDLFVLVKVR